MKLKNRRILSVLMAIVMVLTILPFHPSQVRAAATPALDPGTPVRLSETTYQLANAAFGSTGVVKATGGYFTVAVNNGSIAVGTLASGITELTDGIKISGITTDKSSATHRIFNFTSSNTYEDIQAAIQGMTFKQDSEKTQKVTVNVVPGAPLSDGKTSARAYDGRYFVYVARQNSMTFNDAVTTATNNKGHLVEPAANNPAEMLAIASMFNEFKTSFAGMPGWNFISFIGATKTKAPNWDTASNTLTTYVTKNQYTGLEQSNKYKFNGDDYVHLTLLLDTNNTDIRYLGVNNTHGGTSAYKDPGVIVEYNSDFTRDFITETTEVDVLEGSSLKELQLKNEDGSGIDLAPAFDPSQTRYTANVPNDVYNISINPTAQYPEDTEVRVNLNGKEVAVGDWDNLPLEEGKNTVTVGVYDKNGNLLSEYAIEIVREKASTGGRLTSLVPSTGSLNPAFDPERTTYTMSVGKSVYEMQLTPTSLDPNAKIAIRVVDDVYGDDDWQEVASGSLSGNLELNRGSNTIVVRVTDEDGQYREYTVTVYRSYGSSSDNDDDDDKGSNGGGGGGGSTTTPTTPEAPKGNLDVTLNGNDNPFATGTVSTSNGRTVTAVKVDQGKLTDAISQGTGQKLAIHSPNEGDMTVEGLTADTLKQLSDKGASLEISNLLAIYPVPAGKMDLSAVAGQLDNAALSDIAVRIDIKRASEDVIASAKSKAAAEGYELLVDPVDLDLTFSHGGQTVRAGQLNGYAVKYIALPEGVDPNRITTGVVVNPDGSVYHLPTVVTKIGDRYFAQINDLRSSGTYSVIWNPQDFDDVRNHWGKEDVNNIAARLDLKGNGNNTFAPNRSVTRSEFAEIAVLGLGLMRQEASQVNFPDVSSSAWYTNAVAIADEYDIVRGYNDGDFYGDKQITREQAFAIIARAYRLIQSENAAGQDTSVLAQYKDGAEVSNWAKADVAQLIQAGIIQGNGPKMLNPQATITRAEATAMIARMLKTTNLIDK
ncbi:S-layer homology domain-containing protein [Paenibacillus medicaginis]|uniref:S-layer homology domain-containing protein n=1 Tax=Paenibacillus medicaginis TaxID=1470560 RepID=A0ABV5C367_9BACL